MKEYDFLKESPFIFKKYQVMKKLGGGSFGEVYLGKTLYNGEFVAIKTEQNKGGKSALETEAYILRYIKVLESLKYYLLVGPNILEF